MASKNTSVIPDSDSAPRSSAKLGHAIVVGRSMSGLMAARALSDHFVKVTVLDRDRNPDRPSPRKNVPQGKHIHILLDTGREVLDEFFPGMLQEKNGFRVIDAARDFVWRHLGVWKSRYASGMTMTLSTRYHLEWHVRKQLGKLKNVNIKMQTTVEDLLMDPSGKKVSGVRVKGLFGRVQDLKADLVVDATGRGSRTPEFLKAHGFTEPSKEEHVIDLAYTSRLFKIPKSFQDQWEFLILYPRPPHQRRAGFISRVEKDRWIVSLNGYHKDHAPLDHEGFMEFAKSLPEPHIYDYIKDAKPVGDISRHKIHNTCRNFYEKLARFPDGLVVIGDAVCALNPIFGQGMSTAGLEARELNRLIREFRDEGRNDLKGLPLRYFRRIGKVIDVPWFLTTTEDLRFPQTTGPRPLGVDFLNWYKLNLIELTSTNNRVNQELWKVFHLRRGLDTVLKPSVSVPVLFHGLKSFFIPLEKRARTKGIPELSTNDRPVTKATA